MRGFTIIEVVVATAIMLAVTAAVFAAVQASPDRALAESEAADLHQRIRVALESLQRDGIGAIAVKPNRCCGPSQDPPGVFRTDAVTFVTSAGTTAYWLKIDAPSDLYQLTAWSGGTSDDVPVTDHVVALRCDYFGDDSTPLSDAALSGLRSVVVTVRVEAAAAALRGPAGPLFVRAGIAQAPRRWVPDLEMRLRIAIRGLNLDR